MEGSFIAKRKTMPDHKRNEASVMVMAMYDIGIMLPFAHPVAKRYLESNEPLCIIIIPVYLFAVEQPIDINEIKIETELICFFRVLHCNETSVSRGTGFLHAQVPIDAGKEIWCGTWA